MSIFAGFQSAGVTTFYGAGYFSPHSAHAYAGDCGIQGCFGRGIVAATMWLSVCLVSGSLNGRRPQTTSWCGKARHGATGIHTPGLNKWTYQVGDTDMVFYTHLSLVAI